MDKIFNIREVSYFLMNFDKTFWNEVILRLAIIGIRYSQKINHETKKWSFDDLLTISEQLKDSTAKNKKANINSNFSKNLNKLNHKKSKKNTNKKNSISNNFINQNTKLLLSDEDLSWVKDLNTSINKFENDNNNKNDKAIQNYLSFNHNNKHINKNNQINKGNKENKKYKINYSSSMKELPLGKNNLEDDTNDLSNYFAVNNQKEIEIENNNFQTNVISINNRINNSALNINPDKFKTQHHACPSVYNDYVHSTNSSKNFIKELRNMSSKNRKSYLNNSTCSIESKENNTSYINNNIPNMKKVNIKQKRNNNKMSSDKTISFVISGNVKQKKNDSCLNRYMKIPNKLKKNKYRSTSISDIKDNKHISNKKVMYGRNENQSFLQGYNECNYLNYYKNNSNFIQNPKQLMSKGKIKLNYASVQQKNIKNNDDCIMELNENKDINNNNQYFFKYS